MPKIEKLLKKAQSGDIDSQHQLGLEYFNNNDYPNALKWLNEAASKDHPGAIFMLGCIYNNGWGVKVDKAKAFELLKKASELGVHGADYLLSYFYLKGEVVEQDTHMGQELLAKAALLGGFGTAAAELGDMNLTGKYMSEIDHKKAIYCFKKAFQLGDYKSACRLFAIYNGAYDPEDADPKQAEYWNHIVDQLLDEGKLNDD